MFNIHDFHEVRADIYKYALPLAERIARHRESDCIKIDVGDLRDLVCAGIDYGSTGGSRDMEGLLDWLRGQVAQHSVKEAK